MQFAIDIDGTIAGRNMSAFALACNEQFALKIDQTTLKTIKYRGFMCHEAVMAYREQVGNEAFEDATYSISQAPEMLAVLPVLPGSVEGVRQLAQLGTVAYYTVRKHEDENIARQIQDVTRQWLCNQGFPKPDSVVFCWSVCNKLIRLYNHTLETGEPVILIDDRWQKALEDFEMLADKHSHITELLKDRLTLVAYGASEISTISSGLQVIALPSWSHFDDRVPLFQVVVSR